MLWDADYEMQSMLDTSPDVSERVKQDLGINDDYFTAVPPDPPDEQVRLYLDALIGLTLEARRV